MGNVMIDIMNMFNINVMTTATGTATGTGGGNNNNNNNNNNGGSGSGSGTGNNNNNNNNNGRSLQNLPETFLVNERRRRSKRRSSEALTNESEEIFNHESLLKLEYLVRSLEVNSKNLTQTSNVILPSPKMLFSDNLFEEIEKSFENLKMNCDDNITLCDIINVLEFSY